MEQESISLQQKRLMNYWQVLEWNRDNCTWIGDSRSIVENKLKCIEFGYSVNTLDQPITRTKQQHYNFHSSQCYYKHNIKTILNWQTLYCQWGYREPSSDGLVVIMIISVFIGNDDNGYPDDVNDNHHDDWDTSKYDANNIPCLGRSRGCPCTNYITTFISRVNLHTLFIIT